MDRSIGGGCWGVKRGGGDSRSNGSDGLSDGFLGKGRWGTASCKNLLRNFAIKLALDLSGPNVTQLCRLPTAHPITRLRGLRAETPKLICPGEKSTQSRASPDDQRVSGVPLWVEKGSPDLAIACYCQRCGRGSRQPRRLHRRQSLSRRSSRVVSGVARDWRCEPRRAGPGILQRLVPGGDLLTDQVGVVLH
jgi:hypothetical protein